MITASSSSSAAAAAVTAVQMLGTTQSQLQRKNTMNIHV